MTKFIDLNWTSDFCRSMYQDRQLAIHLRTNLLTEVVESTSGAACMKLLAGLPLGAVAIDGMRKLKLRDLVELDWLELDIDRPSRTLIVPNILKGNASEQAIAAFREISKPSALGQIVDDLHLPWLELRKYDRFLAIWEAGLPAAARPLLTAIYTLRFQAAQPSFIDFEAQTIRRLWRKRFGRTRNSGVGGIVAELTRYRQKDGAGELPGFLVIPESDEQAAAHRALRYLYFKGRSTKVRASTVERQGRSIDKVLSWSSDAQKSVVPPIYGPDRVALRALKEASGENPLVAALDDEQMKRTRLPPRPYALIDPRLYLEAYGLAKPPDLALDVKAAAARILRCLLMHCGRRACCLYQIQLNHINFAWNPVRRLHTASVRITFTKSSGEVGMELPVNYLWPENELEHLYRFLEVTAKFDQNLTLMEVAGFTRVPLHSPDKGYQQLMRLLEEYSPSGKKLHSHVPRITFATWWPVRTLCSEYRYILDEVPCLAFLRVHPWFAKSSLDRFTELLGGSSGHSLNIARQIMGHASFGEFIETYCRSWPLIASLESFISHREGRCTAFHQFLLTSRADHKEQ